MVQLLKVKVLPFLFYMLLFYPGYFVTAQLITAGTYYKDISNSSNDSSNAIENDEQSSLTVLQEEMFQCSSKVDCGKLARRSGEKKFLEIADNADLAQYDEVLKKNNSGFKNCKELRKWGINSSGKVEISWKNSSSFLGYCNMVTDGGDWIVFQRRVDNSSFNRNWTDYVQGFGDRERSFWLGLDALHWLTQRNKPVTLRIDLQNTAGESGYARYTKFKIGSASEKYKIIFDTYQGNIGDALRRSLGRSFSTPDQDNDALTNVNCAKNYHGSWWLNNCFDANLNNDHPNKTPVTNTPEAPGAARMSWVSWGGSYGTIVYSEMMLKEDE